MPRFLSPPPLWPPRRSSIPLSSVPPQDIALPSASPPCSCSAPLPAGPQRGPAPRLHCLVGPTALNSVWRSCLFLPCSSSVAEAWAPRMPIWQDLAPGRCATNTSCCNFSRTISRSLKAPSAVCMEKVKARASSQGLGSHSPFIPSDPFPPAPAAWQLLAGAGEEAVKWGSWLCHLHGRDGLVLNSQPSVAPYHPRPESRALSQRGMLPYLRPVVVLEGRLQEPPPPLGAFRSQGLCSCCSPSPRHGSPQPAAELWTCSRKHGAHGPSRPCLHLCPSASSREP